MAHQDGDIGLLHWDGTAGWDTGLCPQEPGCCCEGQGMGRGGCGGVGTMVGTSPWGVTSWSSWEELRGGPRVSLSGPSRGVPGPLRGWFCRVPQWRGCYCRVTPGCCCGTTSGVSTVGAYVPAATGRPQREVTQGPPGTWGWDPPAFRPPNVALGPPPNIPPRSWRTPTLALAWPCPLRVRGLVPRDMSLSLVWPGPSHIHAHICGVSLSLVCPMALVCSCPCPCPCPFCVLVHHMSMSLPLSLVCPCPCPFRVLVQHMSMSLSLV